MSIPIAEDFAGIAKACKALEREQCHCPRCNGGGWLECYVGAYSYFAKCAACGNPANLPNPQAIDPGI